MAADPVDAAPKQATSATAAAHQRAATAVWLDDLSDRERAERGRIAGPASPQVLRDGAFPVWDLEAFAFVAGPAPDTVHPGLWRQAGLNNVAGLFEVAPGFHQVRGLDLSNLTVVDGEDGRIVIDPLTSADTARAALDLVEANLGPRPVTAVIYTHSHVDHFAGVHGVIDEADVVAGRVRIIAPAGFLHAAISENVVAGNAMTRRGSYMYGALLPKGPRGHVDAGLGKGVPLFGRQGLVAPTEDIETTGTELVVDGVRIVFQVTPDTEAPAEMNFHFPDHRVLCMAENCTCTLHNLYTPRGAPVRDALSWSKYLQEAIELFAADSDVLFASHHWPRWGRDDLVEHLATQRDLYRYLHDQTMRMANKGRTMVEAAEEMTLPAALADAPASRGYYGTVNHNVKAVYQRYLGWFDGNPAHLHPLPPAEAGARYVAAMGGADAVVARAQEGFDVGDYRWVAELLDHVVASEPGHRAATALLADTLEQLGYQAESGPWRAFYLTGAQELRSGPPAPLGQPGVSLHVMGAMTVEMLLDYLGIRLDGLAAARRDWHLDVVVTDRDEAWAVGVERGALHATRGRTFGDAADLRLDAIHAGLAALARGSQSLEDLEAEGAVAVSGDRAALVELLGCLDQFEMLFPIMTR